MMSRVDLDNVTGNKVMYKYNGISCRLPCNGTLSDLSGRGVELNDISGTCALCNNVM